MKYEYTKIEDYCNQLKSINLDMRKQLDSIENIINTTDSSWTGNAADFFIEKAKKLTYNFDEFYKELNSCILYMQKCSDEYDKLDKKVQDEIMEELKSSKFFK